MKEDPLRNCKACGKEISRHSLFCRNCGHPQVHVLAAWIVGGLLLLTLASTTSSSRGGQEGQPLPFLTGSPPRIASLEALSAELPRAAIPGTAMVTPADAAVKNSRLPRTCLLISRTPSFGKGNR